MIDFVTFGIILDDIVFPDGSTRMGVLGGGGPQTAWGMAAALGSGATVGLVAGVGADLDESLLAPLVAAGIDLGGLRRTDLPTPRAWQVTEADGRRTQVWRVPLESLGVQLARRWDVLPEPYRAARHFHWGIHPDDPAAPAFAAELTALGRRVSLEPFRPPQRPLDDAALRALLTACAVFSPNWEEATRLAGALSSARRAGAGVAPRPARGGCMEPAGGVRGACPRRADDGDRRRRRGQRFLRGVARPPGRRPGGGSLSRRGRRIVSGGTGGAARCAARPR